MASTTYTIDSGIKKIGTGLEAGTWGISTNQTYERITAMVSKGIELDHILPGAGSTPGTEDGVTACEWVTLDASDSQGSFAATEDGAQGRCIFIKYKCSITPTLANPLRLEIRGQTTTTEVNRQYLFYNSTIASVLINCTEDDSTNYTVLPGAYAHIVTKSSSDGGLVKGVYNVMSKPQFEDIQMSAAGATIHFDNTGGLNFVDDATITVKTGSTNALAITDGTTTFANLDTTLDTLTLDSTAGLIIDSVNFPVTVSPVAATAGALVVLDGAAAELVSINTSATVPVITVGDGTTKCDILLKGDLDLKTQATNIDILDNSTTALVIQEASTPYITVDTFDTLENVTIGVRTKVPDIELTGTDGYILGTPSATLVDGYGFRNNAGAMEAKVTTSDAWNPIITALIGNDITGVGTDNQAIAAADGVIGQEKKGSIDIGPIRIIFNTITFGGTGNPLSVTLGTAASGGTDAAMDSILYTVMAVGCMAGLGGNPNVIANITSSAGGIFDLWGSTGLDSITYWAIGDSGA